jgi:phage terminase large subunit-like protein
MEYAEGVMSGDIAAGKWVYAAAKRFLADCDRTDIAMDWDEVDKLVAFYARLPLINEAFGEPFILNPWQVFTLANIWGWRWTDDGRRRVRQGILQVARGNGKTTLMAGLCLYDLCSGTGRRAHVIANREEQAEILLDTAKTMVRAMGETDLKVLQYSISRKEADCVLTALPAKESSLDGLTPSLWIADEAAEYRGRFLSKLTSSMAKRREALGVIISTPADTPDNIYGEKISHAEAVLRGEVLDDSTVAMLYGIDETDDTDDEEAWPKANPNMQHGQPARKSLREQYLQSKTTPMGRAEFARYHCCRMAAVSEGWLDMQFWPGGQDIDWAQLRGREAYCGIDLSKSQDLSALVVAVPLDDGRVALRGHYWWPSENVRQRELDYRLPVRNWAHSGKIQLTEGPAISYSAILEVLVAVCAEFSVQTVAIDSWGDAMFAEMALERRVPLKTYSQGIATMGPGCALWQQLWMDRKIVIGDDPVLRNACTRAIPIRDSNGNVKVNKAKRVHVIDPLVASIMAVHAWGGRRGTSWDFLNDS